MTSRDRARRLRKNMTDAERLLWRYLRRKALGHKFRRQVPVGPYIVDFLCLEKEMIIEVDGGQHFENADDKVRDTWLLSEGYKVIRFWNSEVLGNIEGVLYAIQTELQD